MNVAAKNFSESQAFRIYRFGYTLNTGLAHSRHLRYDRRVRSLSIYRGSISAGVIVGSS